jgi:PAS domain S-box-containing protein
LKPLPRAWVVDGPARSIASWLQRFGLHPGGSWSLSWVVLFCGGVVLRDVPESGLANLGIAVLGALFAGLQVVGALAFTGWPAPLWILPAALGLGLARALAWAAEGPEAGHALALLYEPAAALAAAAILWRAPLLGESQVARVGLPLSLVGLAVLEATDAIAGLSSPGSNGFAPAWLVVAPIAAIFELCAMWLWIARRELRIERAEEAQRVIEDKEAWLFDFFEKAPDMLLVLQPGTCEIRRCNRRFSETLGYARRDLVGRPLFDFIDPATLRRTRSALLGPEWRRLRNFELRMRRPDGTPLQILANFALRLDPAGGQPELRAVLHDVTSYRPSPAESLRGEDLPRAAAEHAPAGIFHADLEGRCGYVNPSFCELSGLSPERAREQGFFACLHPQDRAAVQEAWHDAARRGTTLRARHRVLGRPGVASVVVTECVPLVGPGESARGFVGALTLLAGPDAAFSPDVLADDASAPQARIRPTA